MTDLQQARNREHQRLFRERHGDTLRQKRREKYARERSRINAARRAKYPTIRVAHLERDKEYRRLNPGVAKMNNLKKYGITLQEFETLRTRQGDACAICRDPFGEAKTNRPHVDHCHASGKVRGLLCSFCNFGIGHFQDDPERLQAAVQYIVSTSAA